MKKQRRETSRIRRVLGISTLFCLLGCSSVSESTVASNSNQPAEAAPEQKDKDELNAHPAGNTVITLTYEILMESRRFVPEAGMETSVLDLAATGATGPTHLLLQFYDTPTEEEKAQLKARGIELLHYIPTNAWIASVQPSALVALSSNPSIRWGGMLTAKDRTSSLIADETLRAFYANKDNTLPLMVEFAGDVSLDQAKEIVARFGGVVKSEVVSTNSLLIHLPQRRFDALTLVDEIIWIEPALPALEALNDCLRYRIGGDALEATPCSTPGNRLRGMAPAARILSYGFEAFGPGRYCTNPGDIENDWNEAKNSFGADLGTASVGVNVAAGLFPCEWEGNYGEVAPGRVNLHETAEFCI